MFSTDSEHWNSVDENLLLVDDVAPILALLRRRRVRIDPMFAGECKRLFDTSATAC